jgi:hypothetical protein
LETLENRTVMSAATLTTGTLIAHQISPNSSLELPAVVSALPIGPAISDGPASSLTARPLPVTALPDMPAQDQVQMTARPTTGLPVSAMSEIPSTPVHEYFDASAYEPIEVN